MNNELFFEVDDDLTQMHRTLAGYHASIKREGMVGVADVETISHDSRDGYMMRCGYHKAKQGPMGERQRQIGTELQRQVRDLMTKALLDAGWRTKGQQKGEALWFFPLLLPVAAHISETDPVAPKIAGDLPGGSMDELDYPLHAEYQACAVAGSVQAIATLKPYKTAPYAYCLSIPGVSERGVSEEEERLQTWVLYRFRIALREAGWRLIGVTTWGEQVWQKYGYLSKDADGAIKLLAPYLQQIWKGRFERRGEQLEEKFAPWERLELDPNPLWLYGGIWYAVSEQFEIFVATEGLSVRRRRISRGQGQYHYTNVKSLPIVGNASARERGATPAYYRTISTQSRTFTCAWCKTEVTQRRFPGPEPKYCGDACEDEAEREAARKRAKDWRDRQRKKKQEQKNSKTEQIPELAQAEPPASASSVQPSGQETMRSPLEVRIDEQTAQVMSQYPLDQHNVVQGQDWRNPQQYSCGKCGRTWRRRPRPREDCLVIPTYADLKGRPSDEWTLAELAAQDLQPIDLLQPDAAVKQSSLAHAWIPLYLRSHATQLILGTEQG